MRPPPEKNIQDACTLNGIGVDGWIMSRNRNRKSRASGGKAHSGQEGSTARPERRTGGKPFHADTRGDRVLLYGRHPVEAALANPVRKCACLLLSADAPELETLAQERQCPIRHVDRPTLDSMVPPDAVHQGIALEAAPLDRGDIIDVLADAPENAIVLLLDQLTDPHNVGAILRSAAIFGASAVIVQDRNAPAESGTLAKSASGALDQIPYIAVTNLSRALDELKELGFWCVGLAGEATTDIAAVPAKGKIALALGAEGSGLRRLVREHCDDLVKIPMAPNKVGSLNVSNAAAVALYALAGPRLG